MEEEFTLDDNHQPLIPLTVGSELLVEVSDLNLRINSEIVGIDHNQFILVKISENDLIGDFKTDSIKDIPITIMYRHSDVVYRFKTTVLNVVTDPARLFFLEYPDEIEELGLRNKTRHACHVPAQTMLGNDIVDMDILDLSKEGCLCSIKTHAKKSDEPIYEQMQVDIKVDILVNFPVTNEPLNLSGKIRNISRGINSIKLGVVFDDANPSLKNKIADFLDIVQMSADTESLDI